MRLSRLARATLVGTAASAIAMSCATASDEVFSVSGTAGTGGAISPADAGDANSAGGTGGGEQSSGGTGGEPGSCNPAFCPTTFGTPCCLTQNGPCGVDMGMGCMAVPTGGG